MHKTILRSAVFGALGSLSLLGACASIEDVEHAQRTADNAQSTANAAQASATEANQAAGAAMAAAQSGQSAAQLAQADASKANSGVGENASQIALLQGKGRRGERD
jgi:hypothetical protein